MSGALSNLGMALLTERETRFHWALTWDQLSLQRLPIHLPAIDNPLPFARSPVHPMSGPPKLWAYYFCIYPKLVSGKPLVFAMTFLHTKNWIRQNLRDPP